MAIRGLLFSPVLAITLLTLSGVVSAVVNKYPLTMMTSSGLFGPMVTGSETVTR